jgi:hypothetical protein
MEYFFVEVSYLFDYNRLPVGDPEFQQLIILSDIFKRHFMKICN